MRAFITLWAGQTLTTVGSRLTGFALALWLFEQTGQASALALTGLAFGLSSILVNALAGPLVDRFRRKTLIWATDALAALVTLGYLFLIVGGNLQPWHVYTGAALHGALDIVQRLAYSATVSLMVPEEQYMRASAMERFTQYAGLMVGPGLGAALYALGGAVGVIAVDLMTFALAIAIVLATEIPQPEPLAATRHARAATLMGRVKARLRRSSADASLGLRYILARPGLRALLLIVALFNFFDGFPNALIGPMVLARTGNDELAFASISLGQGIGGVTMAALLALWGGPRGERGPWLFAGMIGAGLAKIVAGLSRAPLAWSALSGLASAHFPLLDGSNQAIWLAKTPPALQGRIFAARAIADQFAFFLGYGLAAYLGDYLVEPAMLAGWGGFLLQARFGDSPGAGFALLLTVGALGMALTGLAGLLLRPARRVERGEREGTPWPPREAGAPDTI